MPRHVSKDALRRRIVEQRRAVPDGDWEAEDRARMSLLLEALGEAPHTVALYASRRGEPGTAAIIDRLHDAGWRILLPTLGTVVGWAPFEGWDRMRPGWGGIPEPTTPARGAAALLDADHVVVAGLAVSRDGVRLGTGGGWYDRALLHRRRGVPVWVLTRTQELVEQLPAEEHDVPVDQVFTPDGVFVCNRATSSMIGKSWPGQLS